MLKKKMIFFDLFVILISPISVFAYGISCPQGSYKKGDSFTCSIVNDDVQSFDRLRATIESPDNISCKFSLSGVGITPLETNTENYLDAVGTMTSNKITDVVCSVTDNVDNNILATIVIPDFTYIYSGTVNEFTEVLRSNSVTIEHLETEEDINNNKPRSTTNADSRIKSITDANLDFTFSQFVTEYNISVLNEVTSLNLQIVPNNSNAQIKIEGSQELVEGKNVIDVYATSPDGQSITCYTLNVNRLKAGEAIYKEESDATLESLRVKGHTINFKKEQTEYSVHVTSDVTMLNIDAKAKAANAKVDITNNSNIKNGTVIAVTVTSMDGTQKSTYKINVTKDAAKKNYKAIIIIVLASVGLIGLVAIFIISNNKKKMNDPLLKLKFLKRKINRGKKFDSSSVPEANTNSMLEVNQDKSNVTVNNQDNQNLEVQTNTQVNQGNLAQPSNINVAQNPASVTSQNNIQIQQPINQVNQVQQVNTNIPNGINGGNNNVVYVQPINQPLSSTQQIPVQQIVDATNNMQVQQQMNQMQQVQQVVPQQVYQETPNIFNTQSIQPQQIVNQLQQSSTDTSKQ